MEPSTRTLAPITSTNEAKASMSTASSTASRTSDSPSKSPLWRLPPDVLTNLQPSYWTRRSSHGPPDGGPAGAVPPAGFVLEKLFEKQSMETDQEKRKRLVWEIDRRLQEDQARPIVYHLRFATCWQPRVKGLRMMVNSVFNGWRFEDVWLDK